MLALVALCLFAGIAISALRCAILLRASGFTISTLTVFRLQLIGALFSNVLPGATGGDAVRILYLCRILPTHRTTGILALAIDRFFSLFGLVSLTGILLWLNFSDATNHPVLITYAQWVSIIFGIFVCAALAVFLFARFVPIPVFIEKYIARIRPHLSQVRRAVLVYRQHIPSLIFCMMLSVVASYVVVLGIALLAQTFTFAPSMQVTALAGALGNISSAIPLTPGGIGIGEAVFAKICKDLADVAAPYATIYLVFRVMMVVVSLPGIFTYLTFNTANNRAENLLSTETTQSK